MFKRGNHKTAQTDILLEREAMRGERNLEKRLVSSRESMVERNVKSVLKFDPTIVMPSLQEITVETENGRIRWVTLILVVLPSFLYNLHKTRKKK